MAVDVRDLFTQNLRLGGRHLFTMFVSHIHAVCPNVDPAPLASDDLITLLVRHPLSTCYPVTLIDRLVLCPFRPPSFHSPPAVSSSPFSAELTDLPSPAL